MNNSQYWIQNLNLQPHSEGGFFKETFRSEVEINLKLWPHGYSGTRKISTSIYYLLQSGEISRLHRIRSDELWYYHAGGSLRIVWLDDEGREHSKILGINSEKAEELQILIPAGTIFGAEVIEADSFCLVGCMVSPGFEYDDFELFNKEKLLQTYPKQAKLIKRFTK